MWRYIYTLHYNHRVLSQVLQPIMNGLKECGAMCSGVRQMFYSLLYGLEDDGFLDPLIHTDLFCVHYAILPEVNRCLLQFTDSWNNYSLSTAGNLTPEATMHKLPKFCFYQNNFLERHIFMLFFLHSTALYMKFAMVYFLCPWDPWVAGFHCARRFVPLPRL